MYFVALSGRVWYDTVLFSPEKGYFAGDIVADAHGSYLCLGNTIAFEALYIKERTKPYTFLQPQKLYSKCISTQTLEAIHRLVGEYFSSYKHVIHLYLPTWWENKLPKKEKESIQSNQTCIIYPDLWMLTQLNDIWKLPSSTAILHGGMTEVQKNKLFRWVKTGTVQTLLATNRGLFFDRQQLTSITIYSPSSRSYSAQSEPRFVLKDTAEKIATIYGAKLEYL